MWSRTEKTQNWIIIKYLYYYYVHDFYLNIYAPWEQRDKFWRSSNVLYTKQTENISSCYKSNGISILIRNVNAFPSPWEYTHTLSLLPEALGRPPALIHSSQQPCSRHSQHAELGPSQDLALGVCLPKRTSPDPQWMSSSFMFTTTVAPCCLCPVTPCLSSWHSQNTSF